MLAQLEETERVRQSFGRLLDALADAADRIADEARATAAIPPTPAPPPPAPLGLSAHAPLFASTTPPPPPPPPPMSAPVHEPAAPPAPPLSAAAPQAAERTESPVDRAWVEARQATIHMAAAGNTRGQVETQLRHFLGLAEPAGLLDQVFGAGTDAETRVPWAIAPATPLRPRG